MKGVLFNNLKIMTDKQKQALLLIARLYSENKIGDGELCLLHECIFTASAIPTYVPTCPAPPQPWYDLIKVWCEDSILTYGIPKPRVDINQQHKEWCGTNASDVEIPESILREIKDKKFQGD